MPGAVPVVVYSQNIYFEGPLWDPITQKLYFTSPTDSPSRIYCLDAVNQASIWMDNNDRINGTFLSNDGRMLTAEQSPSKIGSYRIDANGPADKIILGANTGWGAVNDLVQLPNGNIYFTNNGGKQVYLLTPDGTATVVISELNGPNGIAFSRDCTKLCIGDSSS